MLRFHRDEVEIVDGLWIVELNAGNFSRDVAHVMAAERAINTAEQGRELLLEPEQEAIRFHAAGRKDEIAGAYGARTGGSRDLESDDTPAIFCDPQSSDGGAEADLDFPGSSERGAMNLNEASVEGPTFDEIEGESGFQFAVVRNSKMIVAAKHVLCRDAVPG